MGARLLGQIMAIYYPVLAAVGVPVNLVAIVILSRGKCGLSKCVTRYLVGMATADLLALVTDVIFRAIVEMYLPRSFLTITPVCSVNLVLIGATTMMSVWFTVGFTFDRHVAICCQNLKTKYCTERMGTIFILTVIVLSCFTNSPWYFTLEPAFISHNTPRGCIYKRAFLSSPMWASFDLFNFSVTSCFSFVLLFLFNALTGRYILVSGRVRRKLRGCSSGEKDTEIENRRKSVVLLFSISGSCILLWSTFVVYIVSERVLGAEYFTGSDLPSIAFMLQLLSTCTNTGIYVLNLRTFREELMNSVKYPVTVIVKCFKP